MKNRVVSVFLALTLAFSALAAPTPKPQPTITVSCNTCTLSDHISYTGSGFKQGITVYLSVEGPTSRAINVGINSTGGFAVYFAGLLTYQVGVYTVNAYGVSGKRSALLASTAFIVGP